MNLAQKITSLRKQKGWSQEEFAMRLDVSRQSVSKWESGVSIPDMNKIISMSTLFNVTTDFLLKDEFTGEHANLDEDELDVIKPKTVSYQEAIEYVELNQSQGKVIAYGVSLCILAAISVIFLSGTAEINSLFDNYHVQEALGLVGLFLLVAIAVGMFVISSNKLSEFDYIKQNIISLERRSKDEMIMEYKQFKKKFNNTITVSVISFVLSALPLIIGGILELDDYTIILLLVFLLTIVMIGVHFIIRVSFVNDAYEALLNKGNMSKEKKKQESETELLQNIYWPIIVAIYLGWSFITSDWHITWIVWPIAGIVSSIFPSIIKLKNK